jgi:hypothetical protein
MRRGEVQLTKSVEEIKCYFEQLGGKKKVKDTDPVWTQLIKHHNNDPKNKNHQLSFSCGNCRAVAYRWLINQG